MAMAMAATFDRLVSWLSLGKPSVLVYNTGGVTQTFAALHTHTVRAAPRLLTPATGPGSPPPHLHWDWAHPLPRRLRDLATTHAKSQCALSTGGFSPAARATLRACRGRMHRRRNGSMGPKPEAPLHGAVSMRGSATDRRSGPSVFG